MLRTTKVIKEEADNALIKYNDHCNNCEICQYSPSDDEDELTCIEATFLYDEYEGLRDAFDYAEQIFQQELKERSL